VDAFIRAVDAAWDRLNRIEGRTVPVRELCRRAQASAALQAKVFYHLNRKRQWVEGHRVPREVIDLLASQLPIEDEELLRAASLAAGFTVELGVGDGAPDLHIRAIARFWERDDVDEDRKAAVYEQLMDVLREEHLRVRQMRAAG